MDTRAGGKSKQLIPGGALSYGAENPDAAGDYFSSLVAAFFFERIWP